MTSTMIPTPSSGAAFAGATPVHRPGEVGPVVDQQSFADRFDRALTDARSRNDRAESAKPSSSSTQSDGARADGPGDDHDRVGEAHDETNRVDRNQPHHHEEQARPASDTTDIKVGIAVQQDDAGNVANEVAVSVATALGLNKQFETSEVPLVPSVAGAGEPATEIPDVAEGDVTVVLPPDGDTGFGASAIASDDLTLLGGQPERVAVQSEAHPGAVDGRLTTGPPSDSDVQGQSEVSDLSPEAHATLVATSTGVDLDTEEPRTSPDVDASLDDAGGSDEVFAVRSPASDQATSSVETKSSAPQIHTSSPAPSSPASSSSTSSSTPASTSSTVAESNAVGTGPIEVTTNTTSAGPIDLGPNLVAVGSNTTTPPSPVSTNPILPSQQQTTMEAAVSRIADTVEALSKQPPPRAISLDFGEAHGIRVRIAIDVNGVNVTVADAGAGTSDTANWQRQLSESFDQEQHERENSNKPNDNEAGSDAGRTSARQTRQDASLRL